MNGLCSHILSSTNFLLLSEIIVQSEKCISLLGMSSIISFRLCKSTMNETIWLMMMKSMWRDYHAVSNPLLLSNASTVVGNARSLRCSAIDMPIFVKITLVMASQTFCTNHDVNNYFSVDQYCISTLQNNAYLSLSSK